MESVPLKVLYIRFLFQLAFGQRADAHRVMLCAASQHCATPEPMNKLGRNYEITFEADERDPLTPGTLCKWELDGSALLLSTLILVTLGHETQQRLMINILVVSHAFICFPA